MIARASHLNLHAFAGSFLFFHDIHHHREVRTEVLAEAFRKFADLGPFPTIEDLRDLCTDLGIDVGKLRVQSDRLLAANAWLDGETPRVLLRDDLSRKREEFALCHELRELIENAFRQLDPNYVPLPTHINQVMNRKSDHFAACLLMQAEATRDSLRVLGYDFAKFAEERARPLSSVVLRAQELYPAKSAGFGPVGGLWLFEAPRDSGANAPGQELVLQYSAHLSGFRARKDGTPNERRAWEVFPRKGQPASEFEPAKLAIQTGLDVHADFLSVGSMPNSFVVVAEPFFAHTGDIFRVLATAVRSDCLENALPWLGRFPKPRRLSKIFDPEARDAAA